MPRQIPGVSDIPQDGFYPYDLMHFERIRATEKFGQNSREHADWNDAEWLAILGEEFGEVCRELTRDTMDDATRYRLKIELIQLGAMTAAWINAIDNGYNHPRVAGYTRFSETAKQAVKDGKA